MLNRKLQTMTVFTVLAVMLTAAGCYKTPEQRADRIVGRIAEKLDLTDAQKAKLDSIKDEFMAKLPAMRKNREETFDAVIALMKSPQLDQTQMTALVDKNKAQADEFITFIFAKFGEFHDMLTPAQREKAAQELEKWKEHHHGGH